MRAHVSGLSKIASAICLRMSLRNESRAAKEIEIAPTFFAVIESLSRDRIIFQLGQLPTEWIRLEKQIPSQSRRRSHRDHLQCAPRRSYDADRSGTAGCVNV